MAKSGKAKRALGGQSNRARRSFATSGPLLLSLRLARGWIQREAAERAGISDRLVRRAEAGEPIELKSIAMLAKLYSTPEAPLTPNALLAEPLANVGGTAEAAQCEALVRRWWKEVWNQGRLEAIDELTSADCVLHYEGMVLHGRAALRARTEAIRAAFSDIDLRVEQIAVLGDWVITRWHVAKTHTGWWMGMPPTNKRIEVNGSTWMRVENGLLSEGWDYWEQQQSTDAVRGAQPASKRPARTPRRTPPKRP